LYRIWSILTSLIRLCIYIYKQVLGWTLSVQITGVHHPFSDMHQAFFGKNNLHSMKTIMLNHSLL